MMLRFVGYNLCMTLSLVARRSPLSLVAAPAPTTAEEFYDATIPAAWRLAIALHDGDVDRASAATVRCYSREWDAGSPDRTSLLARLVADARTQPRRRGATVVPLGRRPVPPPVPA
jgi:hypothetical protein